MLPIPFSQTGWELSLSQVEDKRVLPHDPFPRVILQPWPLVQGFQSQACQAADDGELVDSAAAAAAASAS